MHRRERPDARCDTGRRDARVQRPARRPAAGLLVRAASQLPCHGFGHGDVAADHPRDLVAGRRDPPVRDLRDPTGACLSVSLRRPDAATRPDAGRRNRQSGQALAIMVIALVALMGMSGLVIDGGNAMANTRGVQNGADAAAEAGALILAKRLAGATTPSGGWDASVNAAIVASAAANRVTVEAAYYTDICGIPLKTDGTASLTAGGSYDFTNAKVVGTGMPNPTSTTPDCPSLTVGPATGVLVKPRRDVATYFARVLGINTLPVGALTTAAAGFLQESCSASDSEWCGLLPLAMPVNQVSCDGSNNVVDTGNEWSADGRTVYKVPLCSNGPGNVGWLDWSPKGGGTSELIDQVQHPTNPGGPHHTWQRHNPPPATRTRPGWRPRSARTTASSFSSPSST